MDEKVRAVTFDLDGTLYDARLVRRHFALRNMLYLRSIRAALAVREKLRGEVFEDGASLRQKETLEIAERLNIRPERARERTENLLGERLNRTLRQVGPRPDVIEILDLLTKNGVSIAVISDYSIDAKLDALGLADFPWLAKVAADEIGALKPSPKPFSEAARQMGMPPHAILHIGDREDTDGIGARQAGFGVRIIDPSQGDPSNHLRRALGEFL